MMRLAACAVVVSLIAPEAAHGKCSISGLMSSVQTAHQAKLPADGAIVVAAVSFQGRDDGSDDVTVQKDWRLRIGADLVEPALEVIAPGLTAYRWPKQTAATTLELVDKAGKSLRAITIDPAAKLAPLRAPNARRIKWASFKKGRSSTTTISVTLDRAPPAGTIALVMTDAKGTPLSWGKPDGTATVRAYDQGRCEVLPNGTEEAKPGQRVKLFWVDASGRRSPASRTLVVGR